MSGVSDSRRKVYTVMVGAVLTGASSLKCDYSEAFPVTDTELRTCPVWCAGCVAQAACIYAGLVVIKLDGRHGGGRESSTRI